MNIQPPIDKLLVELVIEETISAGGIILGQTNMGKEEEHPHSIHQAIVKHIGKDVKNVKIGDNILLEHCYTRPFVFKDMVYKIICEHQIVGVISEKK